MSDDRARKAILARRARFIAAAAFGAGLVGCDGGKTGPSVCLSHPVLEDAAAPPAEPTAPQTAEPVPMPCLAQRPRPVDAGAPLPRVCLKPRAR